MDRAQEILAELRAMGSREAVAGMARFGVRTDAALGVSMPDIRTLAKSIGRDTPLGRALWATGVHEARILASLVHDPADLTRGQMDAWAVAFDSWDVCDQCCMNLFDKTEFAWDVARAWSRRDEEFVKRAGFAMMASLAVHRKKAPDMAFEPFFEDVEREASDGRNFVKKAVSWALRQMGKRSVILDERAREVATRLAGSEDAAARWVGKDALRDLDKRGAKRAARAASNR